TIPNVTPTGPAPSVECISGPYSHENLTIFLVQGTELLPNSDILTLQEALEQKVLVVHETSAVNELTVENQSEDQDVFIQTGDIVKEGKQDRLLALDVIVPPRSGRMPMPSFCVESGRWSKRGSEGIQVFDSSSFSASSRGIQSAITSREQTKVWERVRDMQQKLNKNVGKPVESSESPSSLELTLENKHLQERVNRYEEALGNIVDGPKDLFGAVVVVNGRLEWAETYCSKSLFRKLWPRILNAAAVDALSRLDESNAPNPVSAGMVQRFLCDLPTSASELVLEMAG